MKKSIVLLAVGLLWVTHTSFGQGASGIKGGLNIASIGGDSQGVSSKSAFHGGFFLGGKTSKNFGVQMEFIYSQQGASADGVNIRYNYINMPVIMKVYFDESLNFQIGPQAGILISAKAAGASVKDQLNDLDAAIAIGLGYDTSSRVMLDFRYNLGLTNTVKNSRRGTFPNNVFQISIGVNLH